MPTDLNSLEIVELGRMSYGDALIRQESVHAEVVADGRKHYILAVEHDPVLTMGRNSSAKNLLFSRDFYKSRGVEFFDTERGGEVTAHMPGQLVVYPILNISNFKLSVRDYVNKLEEAVIKTLDRYGIQAHRDAEYPGVWVGHKKICAIGVRVKARVTMHGLALNINNDLSLFSQIIPCGIKFRGVTNMLEQMKMPLDEISVKRILLENITAGLRSI